MRKDIRNVTPKKEEGHSHETLKFFFTPVDEPRPDQKKQQPETTTFVPEVIEALREHFGDAVEDIEEYAGEHTIYVDRTRLLEIARYLKEELDFDYFIDCGAIDLFVEGDRFEMYYSLVSLSKQKRIRVKVRIPEDEPVLPSLVPIYRAANWNEREAFDMMGIRFEGHPDLRRMYMPEDFEYHPQRKEFPQLGVPGSLPLPPQVPEGELTLDPFAAAHGHRPPSSFGEPESKRKKE